MPFAGTTNKLVIRHYFQYENPAIRAQAYTTLRAIPGVQQILADFIKEPSSPNLPWMLLALSFMLKRDEQTRGAGWAQENGPP